MTQVSEVSDRGWNEETEVSVCVQLLGYLLFFFQTQDPGLIPSLYLY